MMQKNLAVSEASSDKVIAWSSTDFSTKKSRRPKIPENIQVRPVEQIPEPVLHFFKLNAKTRQPLSEHDKIFQAQVFMHELDEGLRILEKGASGEIKKLKDFNHKMHLNRRLEILRDEVLQCGFCHLPPEPFHGSHKIRNNQWGLTESKFGNMPVIACTEKGVGYKECNEDAFLLMPQHRILAMADGMGGHFGGNIASGIAIDFFEYAISQHMSLPQAIVFANEAILLRTQSDPQLGGSRPMGCTFAAVQITPKGTLRAAHVGDTKVIVLRSGEIVFETTDHTQGQQLKREGLVDLPTAFELNHILNRCLGIDRMQEKRDVEVTEFKLKSGDRVLLMTDGVTDNFFNAKFELQSIAKILSRRSLQHAGQVLVETCKQLMEAQRLPSGRSAKSDNFSLAALEYIV